MAGNENKKRRIARIGNMSCGKGTKLQSDDDRSLVYDIMQSMDKSQNVISYQQLQEFRSKEKLTLANSSDQNSSSKQNSKLNSSKQIKKFIPEKTFPLMAKCQKSMKYLKKNRCIPKPRAHVGSTLKPSQNPISSTQPNHVYNDYVSNNTVNHEECSFIIKSNSRKSSCFPEINDMPKKLKASRSGNSAHVNNNGQTKSFDRHSKYISDTDSDNEFEKFIQIHHPEKYVGKKTEKSKKFKRKKNKKLISTKKIAKVTRRTLSDSEGSRESEVECSNTLTENVNVDECSLSRFQRIVDYDDNSTDSHINDTGSVNYDSFSSSEDEIIVNESLIKENVMDYDDSNEVVTLPSGPSSVFSSASSYALKHTLYERLKLKCLIPCYVVIKRDPLLDTKASFLHADNYPETSTKLVSNLYDDADDCIIISETATILFADHSSKTTSFIETRNSDQEQVTIFSKSPCVSKSSTRINEVQNEYILNEEPLFNSNSPKPQTETNEKPTEIVFDKSMPLDEREDVKKLSGRGTASRESLSDTKNDECFTSSKATRREDKSTFPENPVSSHTLDLPDNESGASLNSDGTKSATLKEMFNVQILSVKSLNESDMIVLSDDNEGKDTESAPTVNETKEIAEEDSDVEIICLDSSIVNEDKCVKESTKDILNIDTLKANDVIMDNANRSSAQLLDPIEDDCIILDDSDLPKENISTSENVGIEQQSSQVVDIVNEEKTNEIVNKTSNNTLSSDKKSILKILETIDFNCIKKVLNETSAADTEKGSVSTKAENSSFDNIETFKRTPDSLPDNPEPIQNDTCLSQQLTSVDASLGPNEIDGKKSSLNNYPVKMDEKQPKLAPNSFVLQNIKSASQNVPNAMKCNSVASSSNCDKGLNICINLSTNLAASNSFVSGKEVSSRIAEPNTLPHSRKNQQLLPVFNTKMEYNENPSDELDIIAAKSIQNLDKKEKDSIMPLLELYRSEYERFIEIRSTEKNITEGLKLLEDKQAKKLLAISASIKNLVKKDGCFHKINNEFGSNQNELKSVIKSDPVEKDRPSGEMKKTTEFASGPLKCSYPKIEDKVKIFNKSVVERASEDLKSVGSSSSKEVFNHLINSKCAECGNKAVAACLGCAKIYYCSDKCGMTYWNKTHYATCKR